MDLVGLKFLDICLKGEEKPRKTLTQETCPDRESNLGPLRDRRACYRLFDTGGRKEIMKLKIKKERSIIKEHKFQEFLRKHTKITIILSLSSHVTKNHTLKLV